MKKIFLIFLYILFTKTCLAQINNAYFLDKFPDLTEMPTSSGKLEEKILIASDTINYEVLEKIFLISINEIEFSDRFFTNKYYYCGKFKLDSTHYLIGYRKKYDLHARKIVFSIYDVNSKKITSSLTISDIGGCVQRKSHYIDGVFVIDCNYICIPNGLDPNPGEELIQKKYTEKYFINTNFCFEKQQINQE